MSKKDKLHNKFFAKPTPTDITIDEVKVFLSNYGFTLERSNGSHNIFIKDGDVLVIPIKSGSLVKPAYIKLICEKISEIEEI